MQGKCFNYECYESQKIFVLLLLNQSSLLLIIRPNNRKGLIFSIITCRLDRISHISSLWLTFENDKFTLISNSNYDFINKHVKYYIR
ncbi:unnamed protein product [Rotaria socialis]